jgi:hypothetical protein
MQLVRTSSVIASSLNSFMKLRPKSASHSRCAA